MWRNCNGDKFYFLPCLHCLKNCSLCEVGPTSCLRFVSSSSLLHPSASALVSQPQLCKSKFIISLGISDRLSGRRSGSLKCRKAFPSLCSPASQQVCKVNLLPLSKLLSVLKGREETETERERERAIWDFFFPPLPQMPGHAVFNPEGLWNHLAR